MSDCNITDKELSGALDISLDTLYDICEYFDRDPNDQWELIQDFHFVWGPSQKRLFSPEGAVEICNYLEQNSGQRSTVSRWKRWLLRRDRRLKGFMVTKRVTASLEMEGQLVFKGGKAFLGSRACREVLGLGTRQDVLNRAFQAVQRGADVEIEPMQLDVDFFLDEEDQKFYSRSGLASVGKTLGTTLKQQHRQEWARVVAEYGPAALESIERREADRTKRVNEAMDRVRKQANRKCQITGRRCNAHGIDLNVHHIYDKQSYPHLAALETNLIAIGNDTHRHFHQWMGGCDKSCTIEDLIRYVEEFCPSLFPQENSLAADVMLQLANRKSLLMPLVDAAQAR